MAFETFRFKYNMGNFYHYSQVLNRAIDPSDIMSPLNMLLIEAYSKRALKYGRRARDLSSKIGVNLDENFTNMLSCAEKAYEFTKKHNKKS